MKLFIIEDDIVLRTELISLLESYNYSCETSDNFKNIISEATDSDADLILLDINLPYYDGYHVCREIRKRSDVPIMVVTSRNNDMDELMSMNLGADDFITKPYNIQILLARIGAILKRTNQKNYSSEVEYKGLTLSMAKSTVYYENKEVELTKNELRILSVLMQNANSIISRDDLMDELWQSDEFVDDNTLTVNVNRLRKKLEEIGAADFIKTKRGQGYMI
ncbi:DNA-binding response regulator, OmpR family, contains REC and winged-helix (wHTH) domain [Lacrimispora sphenoides]|uniref:Stage 0 sporulation protein A homolog n=1 Tax=Lacrimispora sphenoides JCM 1415 TaxID=1297793 RepID=A0ABY1C9S4_9FIRM|nr:response regulator transcription factor [Lacrimispora sphenoides]SET84168.1 DNA-binding response regulator, OmpR family, contains REC and winged-helix (wHTH) domain [[Clostridium] sphenoides JCM 1415]SEU12384.1 DNA-binding response regulator, OmpR family, contains REC and winged-helix (wHTH) domain [Lacrimispora sphenoides]SUY51685.1 transcriptional regulator [Lacrimispora sphenoides]